ncbi:hypothetical protein SAMN05421852_1267 [Thermoflavimicrobium dichotomicum]|uniref:Helix-turn-helix domain of resolvase n=1 Tax=Thermoflavimicrobium dichotomicum TaxID=46223 RepID=A0A1I3UKU0_9BACL|nr:hypothetical protein SAMN05421852_1267 [Thermoflavimicrobium dichotomicum]
MDLSTLTKEQRKILDEIYPKWKAGEITAAKFMQLIGLKKSTFYKIMKEYENKEV